MFFGQAGQPPEPLSRHRIFHTTDMDEARNLVAKVYAPHDLNYAGQPGKQLDTSMSHVPLGQISLNRLRYGARVNIDVECLGSFLLVMMPIAGSVQIRCGNQQILSTPQLASVISPTLPMQETIEADCDQIMVRIERELLERTCAQHLGQELQQPLRFDLGMEMSANPGWKSLMSYLIAEADHGSSCLQIPLLRAQLEQLVATTLLLGHGHNYRAALCQPVKAIVPSHVKRVEEYISAHAAEPLTVAGLAAYAKVSASSLYAGFRDFRNSSPMAYLKHVRLQRVNQDLHNADQASETVAQIALRWGFRHLGHFATDYKKMFGESPSDTLRK
jgi:AraC-like DNA-binding protein